MISATTFGPVRVPDFAVCGGRHNAGAGVHPLPIRRNTGILVMSQKGQN